MPPITSERSRNQSLAVGVWTGLAIIAVLLWSRRFAGEFTGPVSAGLMVVWATLVSTASATAWWLYCTESRTSDDRLKVRLTAVAVVLAILTSWAGAPGLAPLQMGVVIGLGCVVGLIAWSIRHGESLWMTIAAETVVPKSAIEPAAELPDLEAGETSAEDADEVQTMSRRSTEEGEVIEGVVCVTLPAGDRDAMVHISFCPPLATTPTVDLEDVCGHGWELKIAAAYPFGLRLQVRRGRPCDEKVTGRIAYWAHSIAQTHAA